MRIWIRGFQGFAAAVCSVSATLNFINAQTQVDYISTLRYDVDALFILALGAFWLYFSEILLSTTPRE